jgi:DNA-binding response OmpR family regulator
MSGECRPAPYASAKAELPVVLVVEDEVILRMAVCAHLRDAAFVVIEAVDAEEAVELLQANRSIALVFSDINMPGPLDGNDLAAWIAVQYPEVKVLLTSGIGREGGPPFIAKPYAFAELQRRIEAMLPRDQPM